MAALTAARNTPASAASKGAGIVASGATIYLGALVARNAAGTLVPASDTAALTVMGRATATATAGARVEYDRGEFWYENDGNVTAAHVGLNATVEDDQTVSIAAETTHDIIAGRIIAVDATHGVLIDTRFASSQTAAEVAAAIAAAIAAIPA